MLVVAASIGSPHVTLTVASKTGGSSFVVLNRLRIADLGLTWVSAASSPAEVGPSVGRLPSRNPFAQKSQVDVSCLGYLRRPVELHPALQCDLQRSGLAHEVEKIMV